MTRHLAASSGMTVYESETDDVTGLTEIVDRAVSGETMRHPPHARLTWHAEALPSGLGVRQVYGFIYDSAGRILVQEHEGRFNLPGGKPERGESLDAALHRESLEESQVEIDNLVYLGFQLVVSAGEAPYAQVRYRARLVRVLPLAADPATDQVYARRFVLPDELEKLLGWTTGAEQIAASERAGH